MERREKPRVGRVLVYGLLDPRDATLRYVGKTHKRREVRLAEHLERAAEGSALPVHRWVRELTKARVGAGGVRTETGSANG